MRSKQKSKPIFIDNIFVDTSIFEEQNFFHGTNIRSLLHYSNIGFLKLHLTTISKMELIDRMKTRLENSKSDFNKVLKSLNNQEHRILKNINVYDQIKLPQVTVSTGLQQLSQKLETNIRANKINLIDCSKVLPEKVFERYYQSLPPFGPGKKKHEFPDAFIIMSLEAWCKEKKKRMIVLSKDNDFHKFKCRHLIFKDNLTELLQEITERYDSYQSTKILPIIRQLFDQYKNELLEAISKEISETAILKTDFEKTSNFKIEHIDIIEDNITSIRDYYADVQLIVKVTASMTVHPSPQDIERAIFEDKISKHKIIRSIISPVEIEVHYKREKTAKIKWINMNDPIILEFY